VLYIYIDLSVTNYCTMILHILRVSAETIQSSSGRPLLRTQAACNVSLNDKNICTYIFTYVHIFLPFNDTLHAASLCKRGLPDDDRIVSAETRRICKTIMQWLVTNKSVYITVMVFGG
jgi:hypothetical protein